MSRDERGATRIGARHRALVIAAAAMLGCALLGVSGAVAGAATGPVSYSSVVAGHNDACAISVNGALYCWGLNNDGQLGTGSTLNSNVPVEVSRVPKIINMSLGRGFSCAVLRGGAVECWGSGASGELGNGTTANSLIPVRVRGVAGAKDISLGLHHACAIVGAGEVKCWGSGASGELGNGSSRNESTAVAVKLRGPAKEVSLGSGYSCALLTSGAAECWGAGSSGQLGNRSTRSSHTAVAVSVVSRVGSIEAGGLTCAALSNKSVKCWGAGSSGQLGNGSTRSSLTAVSVEGLGRATEVSVGSTHACAVTVGGEVKCWGAGGAGQLGNGTYGSSSRPVVVTGLAKATEVSAGADASCALLITKNFTCWGANSYGQLGNGSNVGSDTPGNGPAAATDVVATAGNSSAVVNWQVGTAGVGVGISYAVTSYDLSTSKAGATGCAGESAVLSCNFSGLTNGDSYDFVVVTSDATGSTNSAVSNSVTPQGGLAAPSDVVGTSGADSGSSVSWVAPTSNGGSPITGYVVEYSSDAGSTWSAGHSAAASPLLVTGLTNGDSYVFRVAAINIVGTGPWSASSPGATVGASSGGGGGVSVPQPPTAVAGTSGGNENSTVSWIAPTNNGGAPITAYVVEYSLNGTTWSAAGSVPASPVLVSGLTNATSYTFEVAATNSAGTGAFSAPSAAIETEVNSAATPAPPTGVAGTSGGNESSTVSWSAPASNGGAPVTSYVVEYSSNAGSTWTTANTAVAGTSYLVSGLANGTSYVFQVAATNSAGTGAFSVPSAEVSTQTSIVTSGGITGTSYMNEASVVTWSPPASDGGSPILGYIVAYSSDGGNTWIVATQNTPGLTYTVTGLVNGDSYLFRVAAFNAVGTGPWSASGPAATPSTTPNAPSGAVGSNNLVGSSLVSWVAPTDDGGAPVESYTVSYSSDGGSTWTVATTIDTQTSYTVTGLTNASSYLFEVVATNGSGPGPADVSTAVIIDAGG